VPESRKVRIQLDLRPTEARALDAIRDRCELRSRADAVRTALAVIEWVQLETRKGHRILAVGSESVTQLAVPGLTTLLDTGLKQDREE
jgi:hypothetical protein